jgi:hypothetical protein
MAASYWQERKLNHRHKSKPRHSGGVRTPIPLDIPLLVWTSTDRSRISKSITIRGGCVHWTLLVYRAGPISGSQ